MSQDYKYAGEPLSTIAAVDYLKGVSTKDEAIKKGHSTELLMNVMEEYHVEKGGLSTDSETLAAVLRQALRFLSRSGHATELIAGRWRLSKTDQRIFGCGQHWVYLYYFSEDKKKAESQEKSRWRCRVGRAKHDPEGRIARPTKGTPVPPQIALLLRTDKWVELEGAIHRTLKLRGQHLEKLQGAEWFDTNPDEVLEIYDFIVHRKPNYTRRAEYLDNKRAIRDRKRLLKSQSSDDSDNDRFHPID